MQTNDTYRFSSFMMYAGTICDRGAKLNEMILFKEISRKMRIMKLWLEMVLLIYSTFSRLLNSSCCFSLHSFFGFILFSWPSLPWNKCIIIFTYAISYKTLILNIPLQIDKTTLSCYHRFHSIRKVNGTLPFFPVHWGEIPHIADYSPARHHHI